MKRFSMYLVVALAVVLGSASSAWAKDAVRSSISNWTGEPIVTYNGNPYSQGTYAIGTIHVNYVVVGTSFTAGEFGSFDLDWDIAANLNSGGATNYDSPITLELEQIGGTNIILSPSPDSFSVSSNAATGSSTVTISINPAVLADLELNCDGCELVANLRLSTSPSGAKLDTVTNVLIKIKLVHPTACLKVYNFVTDQEHLLGTLNTTSLNVPTRGANAGKVVSSQPGQYSDNVLIANTCSTDESFDLKIALDPKFETNPSGNPGQAVFTYSTSGEVDPGSFNISGFGTGTPQGQQLCLQNVTVGAGTTFLATVHSQVIKGTMASSLPGDGSFDFSATLYQSVNSGCTGALHTVADPNPATFVLPFTIN